MYDPYGRRIAVTAVQAGPCTVVSVRENGTHQYQAIQVGFEPVKPKKLNKAKAGHLAQANVSTFRYLREFRLNPKASSEKLDWKVGETLTVELFKEHELVDVTGISIGKGFQGGMKRWNWSGGNETHGSTSHRRPGSIGSTTTPGRVLRGHHLPGHMGARRTTVQHIRVIGLNSENNLLWLQGAIPGPDEGLVMVRRSIKYPGRIKKPREMVTMVDEEEPLNKNAKAAAKKK